MFKTNLNKRAISYKMVEYNNLEQCIALPISHSELLDIVGKAKDYAIMHGAGMRSKTNFSTDSLTFAPFLLTPSSFPRREFHKCVALQTILNRLIHHVAHDEEFLSTTLAATIKVDDFTWNLFNIYKKSLAKGLGQRISLGILRSDFMLESEGKGVQRDHYSSKQVEINTMASGFGHLGPISKTIQSYVLAELSHTDKLENLPENKALSGICEGIVRAWEIYQEPKAAIMFIIEDVSYNICDQRYHEFYIRQKYSHVKVLRRTLTQVHSNGRLSPDNELEVDGLQVAVIYFRAGYEPAHYHSQNKWSARLMMECSKAIKCPSINYHLAGTKKVQQALAAPNALNRFLCDSEEIKAIANTFTGLYSLDGDDERSATVVEMALTQAERFVLKPQREGGGNNVYGLDILDVLRKLTKEERSAWILMDRIQPPISKGYMVRPDADMPPPLVDIVSELGIFGVIMGDANNIICNYQAGHMLRTKSATANEGGVAAGLGALDSPYLVD